MWLYIVPTVVFVVISLITYAMSKNKDKNKPGNICLHNILPAIAVSVLVFLCIMYQQNIDEPMMGGNYFDTVLST
jgi:phosphoglycerol transferase MdoB-like AlkP superfamily enzyme